LSTGDQELCSLIIRNHAKPPDTIREMNDHHQQLRVVVLLVRGLVIDRLEVDAGLVPLLAVVSSIHLQGRPLILLLHNLY
jgi:hypothetical protein